MALLRAFEDREYWPEYGTFLVRETEPHGPVRVRVAELLGEGAVDTQPCGSIARAGDGWIEGRATDRHHEVRLEAHDAPSPTAGAADDWPDVVETPFATGGTVGLSSVTGMPRDALRLGEPGLYRVRFCRGAATDGDRYLLQCWPVSGPPQPPRWIARSQPLLQDEDIPWAGTTRNPAYGRLRYAVADLVILLLWAQESRVPVTVGWLAKQLLSTPDAVRAVLRHAVGDGTLAPFDDTDEVLTLMVQPPRPPTPQPPRQWAQPAGGGSPGGSAITVVAQTAGPAFTAAWARRQPIAQPAAGRRSPRPPAGRPPTAGLFGAAGDLLVWRDGSPEVLARWPAARVTQALQTRHGTVLLTSTQVVLARDDGDLVLLGTNMGAPGALDATGEHLAVVETHLGRRSWHRLHLIDLADGSRSSMPYSEENFIHVNGIHDGTVYVTVSRGDGVCLRWVPGSDPQPLPYILGQVDPYSGMRLARDRAHPQLLIRSDGTRIPLAVDQLATLTPGGQRLCRWVHSPPSLELYDLPDPDQKRMIALPGGSQTSPIPGGPVWEDPDHVLVPAANATNDLGVPLIRLHVRTSAVQAIELPPEAGYRPVLVTPLWRASV